MDEVRDDAGGGADSARCTAHFRGPCTQVEVDQIMARLRAQRDGSLC